MPGLEGEGIERGDGVSGDMGGLKRVVVVSAARAAPGLKLKLGRAAGRPALMGAPTVSLFSAGSRGSMADRVLRPVALEKDDGADAGALAGKTKGGRGLAGIFRGEAAASSYAVSERSEASIESILGMCRVDWRSKASRLGTELSRAISGPNVVAILIQPLCGTQVDEQPGVLRRTSVVGKEISPGSRRRGAG